MSRPYHLHHFFHEQATPKRHCDYYGCGHDGEYKAPKSPSQLHEYYWFCLDHVREYNLNWDYYKQLSQQEIERLFREDVTWQRPTWKFGSRQKFYEKFNNFLHQDFFATQNATQRHKHDVWIKPNSEQAHALTLFELSSDVTLKDIKIRYKQLAKKYHPDLNPGCPQSQDMLKNINHAYQILKKKYGALR